MTNMAQGESYEEFFRRATGHEPHGYQRRVAEQDELPALIEVPPGQGKTYAVLVAWLWRRRAHPDLSVRARAPRRLVYALPQRTLVDQVGRVTAKVLDALGLADEVRLHVVMGGMFESNRPWESSPEADSIFIGTVDIVVSKFLVRGYGIPRNAFPMDAALVWNDAHIVIDEVQGAPASTVTLRQVDAFRAAALSERSRLTCMSATVPDELLDTVDNPHPDDASIIRPGKDDVTADFLRRRDARRLIRKAPPAANPRQLAQHVLARHRPGRLTLVVLNTVRGARDVHQALKRAIDADLLLLHSQFRPIDRQPLIDKLGEAPPPVGRIVVATQVVEAGLDIDADILVTEAAPWSSMVQRSGRCNRCGLTDDAELWWVRPAKPAPYEQADLDASMAALSRIDGWKVTNEELLQADADSIPLEPPVLRRADFYSLFDTSPDLAGYDLDIAPYIRDTDDLAVQLGWAKWDGTAPPEDTPVPRPDWRCRIPIGGVSDLINAGKKLWHFDPVAGRWQEVDKRRVRPGEVILLRADQGGYRPDVGFDPSASDPVDTEKASHEMDQVMLAEDESGVDPRSFAGDWISLDQHLEEAAEEAAQLVSTLDLPKSVADDVVLAARIHDIGKAHPTWQDALCGTAAADEHDAIAAGRPWAKSKDTSRRLRYAKGIRTFSHELAGLVLLDGPLNDLLNTAHDPDLVRYLVLAHHGRVRVQIRDPRPTGPDLFLGLKDRTQPAIPGVLGHAPGTLQTSLAWLTMRADDATPLWPDVINSLIERYTIFRLAYFETLVRVADWRASARHNITRGTK